MWAVKENKVLWLFSFWEKLYLRFMERNNVVILIRLNSLCRNKRYKERTHDNSRFWWHVYYMESTQLIFIFDTSKCDWEKLSIIFWINTVKNIFSRNMNDKACKMEYERVQDRKTKKSRLQEEKLVGLTNIVNIGNTFSSCLSSFPCYFSMPRCQYKSKYW